MEIPIEYDENYFGGSEEELSEVWIEAAKKNCNDYPELRAERLAEFRNMLDDKKILLKPGDDRQLLGILRTAKFDMKKAMEITDVFLETVSVFKNADVQKARDWLQFKSKDSWCLPHRDKHGRRVLCYRMWDGSKMSLNTFGMFMQFMAMAREPKTQIAGITMLGDMTGTSRKHIPSNVAELRAYANLQKGGVPAVFHKSHILDPPFFLEMVSRMAKPIFSQEFFDNMPMYKRSKGLDELYKDFNKEYIPNELGGTLGNLDDTEALKRLTKLDDYFEEIKQCKRLD